MAASTAWEILKKAGIDRSRAAADCAHLVAVPAFSDRHDPGAAFFTADLLDGTHAYVLAVIEHASRRIRILGITLHPTGEWTAQQARNLLMDLAEQTHRLRFMIRDRGPDFTATFDTVLADAGIRTVLCNVRTPRMNAIAERGMPPRGPGPHPLWNQAHLRQVLRQYETPPQSAPAAPRAGRRCPTETATRTGRSRPVPRPETGSRRWSSL